MDKLKEIIKANYNDADCGIYFTRNTSGDKMTILYSNDKYTIYICYGLSYFEIFGLDETEQKKIFDYYSSLDKE